MVRQWQTLFYDHRYSHTTIDRQTDYVKLAEAFGGKGLRIQTRHDIKGVMKEAMHSDVPASSTAGSTRMTVSIRSYRREKARRTSSSATREMRA
ncbi:MAG: thiamine pyrophosphate-dependent enzyme [Merdibacter sp.]